MLKVDIVDQTRPDQTRPVRVAMSKIGIMFRLLIESISLTCFSMGIFIVSVINIH